MHVCRRRVPKVDELQPRALSVRPHEVIKLEVAVDDADALEVAQSTEQLHKGAVHVSGRQQLARVQRRAHHIHQAAAAAQREADRNLAQALEAPVQRADVRVAQALVDGDLLADPSDLVLVEPLFRHHLGGHLGARIAKICQPDQRRRTLSKQCVTQLDRWLRLAWRPLARRLLGCCPLTGRSLGWRSLARRHQLASRDPSIALRPLLLLEALA